MPRPKKPMLEPVQKLAKMVTERGEIEPDGHMPVARRAEFLSQYAKGGPKYDFVLRAKALTLLPDRIHYLAQLMATGAWRSPLTMVLANAWEVSPAKIHSWRAEATRLLQLTLGDMEMLKNTTMAFFERIAHDAADEGDYKNAIAAGRTFAEVAGLMKQTHEFTGPDGGPLQILAAVKTLTDAELDAEIARAADRRRQQLELTHGPAIDVEPDTE